MIGRPFTAMTLPVIFEDVVGLAVLLLFWYFDPFALTSLYRYTGSQRDAPPSDDDLRFAAAMRRQPLPAAVFGIVWGVLYFLIAYAQFVYARDRIGAEYYSAAHMVFFANWLVNKLWTPTFFGGRSPGGGLFIIVLVLGTAIALVVLAALDSAPTVVLVFLILYAVWVLVATGLNIYILQVYSNVRIDGSVPATEPAGIRSATTTVGIKVR